MKIFARRTLLVLLTVIFVLAAQGGAAAPAPPNPVLYFLGQEPYETGGKQFMRYRYDVFNKDAYPTEMFAAAPELPPCGTNTKAARTWVDLYDQTGKPLNRFCALGKPSDLSQLWFGLEAEKIPPSWIYIEMNDRKTSTKYKSNLAETTY